MGQVVCYPFFHANESLSSLAGTLLVTIARAATAVNVMFPLAAGHRMHVECSGGERGTKTIGFQLTNDEVLGDKVEAAAPGLCRLGGTANEFNVTYFAAALAGLQNCHSTSKALNTLTVWKVR